MSRSQSTLKNRASICIRIAKNFTKLVQAHLKIYRTPLEQALQRESEGDSVRYHNRYEKIC